MVRAQGRRKRKGEGKAEASGSGNSHNVAQKARKRKTGSVSGEEWVPAARPVRERKAVDRFVPGPQPNEKYRESKVFSIEQLSSSCQKERLMKIFKFFTQFFMEENQMYPHGRRTFCSFLVLFGLKMREKRGQKLKNSSISVIRKDCCISVSCLTSLI